MDQKLFKSTEETVEQFHAREQMHFELTMECFITYGSIYRWLGTVMVLYQLPYGTECFLIRTCYILYTFELG